MPERIYRIKKLIAKECKGSKHIEDWFYGTHLLAVEKFAKKLLLKLPRANSEVVMLGVWLHDLQWIRGIKGSHERVGAVEAEKVMKKFGYSKEKIKEVKGIILTHTCSQERPKTLEGRILASADAMSHYVNDFYLTIAATGQRNLKEYKAWALEKLDRDYNKKISFGFAKKTIKERHQILKKFFTMK